MTLRARLAVLLLALLPVPLTGAAPAAAADDGTADRVVVVGVPGLEWTDVSEDRTPQLWGLAEEGAVGALTVRAARSLTCVLDGWATLGAGNRARYPLPQDEQTDEAEPAEEVMPPDGPRSLCDVEQGIAEIDLGEPGSAVARIADDEATRRFGAEPGALGAAVGCATTVGRPAALAVAADGVDLRREGALPEPPQEVTGLLDACPLTLVSLDGLFDTADVGPEESESPLTDDTVGPERAAALAEVDGALGRVRDALAGLDGDSLLLVAGVSEVDDDRSRLHVAVAAGPGFGAGTWLTSSSTGRTPYVQLIDLAPTALDALGRDLPASVNGQPLRPAGERPALSAAVDRLEELNVAARAHYRSDGVLYWSLVVGVAAVVALGVAVLGRRPGSRHPGRTSIRLLRTGALVVAAAPIATYLAGLVPWERTGAPQAVLLAAVVGADLLVVLLAVGGPWRRHRLGPPLAVLAVTAATPVADVLTGSSLEMNGLLGYDAIVAGRFTGFGNLSFGLLSVSLLLLTTACATALARRVPDRRKLLVTATVVAVGLLAVVMIGFPSLGRDFGGVLAALPGFALLWMFLTGTRVTVVRLAAVLGAAVVAVGSLAVLDWLRPAADRTHLGRFVEQVRTGEALTVVLRKAQANLDILLRSPLVWTLAGAAVAAVWLLRPGGLLRTHPGPGGGTRLPGGLPAADVAALRAGLLAVLVALVLGAAVNDSGVAVPATAAALLVPLLVWLVAGPDTGSTGRPEEGDAPRSGPADDGDRVTVVSRGSTVSNA